MFTGGCRLTGNILGERFVLVSFGESHGKAVGAVVDGCPAGLEMSEKDIQKELDLRRPGTSPISTSRSEEDRVEILSGVFKGYTSGSPICMITQNVDVDSRSYESIRGLPRPGHADYMAAVKYGGFNDYRGGGRFSARRTVSYVMGGAVAKKLLLKELNVKIIAYTVEVGGIKSKPIDLGVAEKNRFDNSVRCPDLETSKKMIGKIMEMKKKGDSVGGVIEGVAINVPQGLGEPCFSDLDAGLARSILSIPAVKGVEFGSGFDASRRVGSENNDPLIMRRKKITFGSNNAGGIIGGLSNGMPIVLRVAFKPVSSIAMPQKTVNIDKMEDDRINIRGRHDTCVVPRAVPIVESVVALVLADHAIRAQVIAPVVKG